MKVIPAILSDTIDDFEHKLHVASTLCTSVQIDVAAGDFTMPFRSLDYNRRRRRVNHDSLNIDDVVDVVDESKLTATYHLMTRDIVDHISKLQSHNYHRIIIHAEASPDYRRYYKHIDRQRRGLAINPETPIADALRVLDDFDELLIMTVHPGRSGGRLIPEALNKIERAKQCFPHLTVSADGGIGEDNLPTLRQLGYDIAYVGSTIFNSPNPKEIFDL